MTMKTHDSTGKRATPFWSEQPFLSEDGNSTWGVFVVYHPDGHPNEYLWPWELGYITPCDQRLKQFSADATANVEHFSPGLPHDANSKAYGKANSEAYGK